MSCPGSKHPPWSDSEREACGCDLGVMPQKTLGPNSSSTLTSCVVLGKSLMLFELGFLTYLTRSVSWDYCLVERTLVSTQQGARPTFKHELPLLTVNGGSGDE